MGITKKDLLSLINKRKMINEMPMDFNSPDRPHKDYEDKLGSQETPFKKVPFPSTGKEGQNFQELLGSEDFKSAIDRYKQYQGDDETITSQSASKVSMGGMRVLQTIMQMEAPHKTELTDLAVNLVKQQFSIPEGAIQFDAKIINGPEDVDDEEEFNHDEEGEENPEEPDIDMGDDFEPDEDELTKLEKSKRRLVNATLQGASRVGQYMFHLVEDKLTQILGRDDAPILYGKMMSMNDLQYWLFPDEMIKQASKQKGGKAGDEKVDRNTEPPTIYARGINFPVLVHELIKGLMEFFALQPQGDVDQNYYDRVRSEDTITKEDWDLRLGVAIWSRLRSLIPAELHTDEKVELQNYILNHIFNLPAKQYLILMREVMGKTDKGRRAIEKIAKNMQDLYDDIHDTKYKDDTDFENYDEDGFYTGDDEEDDVTPTPTKPIQQKQTPPLPKTDVDFDLDNEKWRLNESYTDRYKQNPWSGKENLIAFYCAKFDPRRLLPKRGVMNDLAIQIIANYYIGTTEDSLILQMNNFKYLLSNGKTGMSDSSELQRRIFEKYKDVNEETIREICVNEMDKINTRETFETLKRILDPKLEKTAEIRRMKIIEKNRVDDNERRFRDEIKRMAHLKNLDPKSLKHIGTREKELPNTDLDNKNDEDEYFINDRDNDYFKKLDSLNKQLDNPITIDLSKFKDKKRPWN